MKEVEMKWLVLAGVLLSGTHSEVEDDDALTVAVELPGVKYVLDVTNGVCFGRPHVGKSVYVLLRDEQCKRLVVRYGGRR